MVTDERHVRRRRTADVRNMKKSKRQHNSTAEVLPLAENNNNNGQGGLKLIQF
jgi:hypothetical protein